MKTATLSVSLFLVCSSAWGVPTLDQEQAVFNYNHAFGQDVSLAQTFTAGLSGRLTRVEVGVSTDTGVQPPDTPDPPNGPSTIEIRLTDVQLPVDAVLGRVSAPSGFSPGWNSVDFLSQDVFVTAGTMYAIVIWSDEADSEDYLSGAMDTNDPYTGGQLFVNEGSGWFPCDDSGTCIDAQFCTYVDPDVYAVPIPGAALLSGLGVALGRLARRNIL